MSTLTLSLASVSRMKVFISSLAGCRKLSNPRPAHTAELFGFEIGSSVSSSFYPGITSRGGLRSRKRLILTRICGLIIVSLGRFQGGLQRKPGKANSVMSLGQIPNQRLQGIDIAGIARRKCLSVIHIYIHSHALFMKTRFLSAGAFPEQTGDTQFGVLPALGSKAL